MQIKAKKKTIRSWRETDEGGSKMEYRRTRRKRNRERREEVIFKANPNPMFKFK